MFELPERFIEPPLARLIHRTLLGWRRLAVSRPETSSLWGSELGLEMVGGVIAP